MRKLSLCLLAVVAGAFLVAGAGCADTKVLAQRDGLELLPFCPFVRAYLRKNPEFLSLVPTQRRDDFELPGAPR